MANSEDEAVCDILKNKSLLAGVDDVRSVVIYNLLVSAYKLFNNLFRVTNGLICLTFLFQQ